MREDRVVDLSEGQWREMESICDILRAPPWTPHAEVPRLDDCTRTGPGHARPSQELRLSPGPRWPRPDGSNRCGVWVPRPERSRQDDNDAAADRSPPARQRHDRTARSAVLAVGSPPPVRDRRPRRVALVL